MASLSKDKNGNYRLFIVLKNGQRPAIRFGKISDEFAADVKTFVEKLIEAAGTGFMPDQFTLAWCAQLPARWAEQLAKFGLLPKREVSKRAGSAAQATATNQKTQLGTFIDDYIANRSVKPSTKVNLKQTRRYLVAHFGESRQIRTITAGDAEVWREALRQGKFSKNEKKLAAATVSRQIKRARTFFLFAVRSKLIDESPFAHLKAGSQTNKKRLTYVARTVIADVIKACPNAEWRLIVALARYAGLRCPSELGALKWGDVDFAAGRLTVHACKTEHHENGGVRFVPIFPALRPYLDDALHMATSTDEKGAKGKGPKIDALVLPRLADPQVNLRTQLERILKRAGVKQWPRLFQNLRASMAMDLANSQPIHVAAEWMGHTVEVMAKYYLKTTDEQLKQAAGLDEGGALLYAVEGEMAQIRTQHHPRILPQDKKNTPEKPRHLRKTPKNTGYSENEQMTPTGSERLSNASAFPGFLDENATSGAQVYAVDSLADIQAEFLRQNPGLSSEQQATLQAFIAFSRRVQRRNRSPAPR